MKYKIVSTLLTVALVVTSCNKFLDIKPQFKFVDTLALSTLDGLDKTTTGAFSQLQSGYIYGGGLIGDGELLADFLYTDPIADFNLNQLRTHQLNSFNGESGGLWGDAYRGIYIANVVLQNLPKFAGQNPPLEAKLKAECLFIRGILHFELVRMFAQPSGYTADDSHLGVPIVLTPGDLTHGQNTPRSTVAQVYAQVIADLTAAEANLPADKAARASKYAADAFLARAYFYQAKYADAKTWADKVINGSGLSLNDSINAIYSQDGIGAVSNETIFQLVNTTSGNDVSNGAVTGRFKQISFPALYKMGTNFLPYLSADSAVGGLRYAKLYKKVGARYYTKKYDDVNMNVPVIRLAEILLLRAECIAQTGGADADARADLNLVRVRAGLLPDNTTSGQQALLVAIRGERDYELAFEGDRFYELKRRRLNFNTQLGVYAWNDNRLVYPIPQQEVDENKQMVQNPGY